MNILFALLFTRALPRKRLNPKRFGRKVRKEAKFWVQLITELVQLTYIIFRFVFVGVNTIYKKCICQKTVEENIPSNVILLDEYKLKKAK